MSTILVIDDDAALADILRQFLVQMGHQVLLAENGKEGLRLFETNEPALIITDIVMPESEGIETIMEIRRRSSDVPIIAMSGFSRYGSDQYLKMAAKLGAQRTLAKPFRGQDVLEAVNALLPVRETKLRETSIISAN